MENKKLIQMRKKINRIDGKLMMLLERRAEIVKAIGKIKFEENLPILNKAREEEILESVKSFSNHWFISEIFIKIFDESRKIQEKKWK